MPENAQKKFRIINYLLVALIVIALLFLIRTTITLSLAEKEPLPTVSKDRASMSTTKKNIMQYSDILEKNPFGPPMQLSPIAVTQNTEIRYGTPSDLILLGTAVGADHLSYAIFENRAQSPSGQQEIFALGQEVFNFGILKKIKQSSVEIERNAMTYTIAIQFEETMRKSDEHQEQRTETSGNSFAKKVSEREYVLDSRRVQRSLENPEQILTDARLLPNIRDGRQEGFTISEVVPDGLYHSLGLRNGDILLRVNGLEISNPEVAIQAMTALKGMSKVNLAIIRNGKNMSMNYQIQ